MDPVFLLRLTRMLRHRRPMWQIKLGAVILLSALAIYGIEHFWGWPAYLMVNGKAKLP